MEFSRSLITRPCAREVTATPSTALYVRHDPARPLWAYSSHILMSQIIAIVASIAIGIQNYAFGASSERLSRIIRVRVFAAILRQDVSLLPF